jgi:hypothetical protein
MELKKNHAILYVLFLSLSNAPDVQAQRDIDSFIVHSDIKVTIDKPGQIFPKNKTVVVFFALPNGNTTGQTMGKLIQPGDDWHYDIQHIRAQTDFVRRLDKKTNYVVVYLENSYKSWPSWKQRHPEFRSMLPTLVDSLATLAGGRNSNIYLNGHSGGGSFIFGFLAGVKEIPGRVKRISFIDSNYGYDSTYFPKLDKWLKRVKGSALTVFAYNDSVALYNGKPVVSATGGTWYRGHLMLRDFSEGRSFTVTKTDSLEIYKSKDESIQFYFKYNLNRGIYHTQQVELNGFIHSIFCGTKYDSKGYTYYGTRAYSELIE